MALHKNFFFGPKWTFSHLIYPSWWVMVMIVVLFVPFLRVWWWVFFPLVLSIELKTLYLWWLGWDVEYAGIKWVILEIIPPKEILVPLKAMEDILATMWGPLVDTANFRDKWVDGELTEAPYWMSWEIVSVEGSVHFYARVMANHRSFLESSMYSHYPELEIREVSDYTKNVPQDIPNKEWNLYGEDLITIGKPGFPIKTYEKFFEPQGEKISAEEKRIDSINSLLESMSRLGPGEQYWVQFIFSSASTKEGLPEYEEEAKKIISKLTKRPEKVKKTFWGDISDMAFHLVHGPMKEGSGEKASYAWAEREAVSETGEKEMLLTPGERETLLEIESKLRKPTFRTTVRGIYLAKRENYRSFNGKIMRTYVSHFATSSQFFDYDKVTATKVNYIFRKRRIFIRARRLFRNAVARFSGHFPERKNGTSMLNSEELTTLFHFPIKLSSLAFPTVERVEHRKGGPPANLPIE